MNIQCLHSLPKFMSKCKSIQVGNGTSVSILFIVPVIIEVHGLRFEIYANSFLRSMRMYFYKENFVELETRN